MNLNNIVSILLNKIPEFKNSLEFFECQDDHDLPYVIFGRFVNFVVRMFKEGKNIEAVFSFLDEMANSNDDKITELLMFGFLENLNSKESYYNDLVNSFSEKTKQRLQETIDHNNLLAS